MELLSIMYCRLTSLSSTLRPLLISVKRVKGKMTGLKPLNPNPNPKLHNPAHKPLILSLSLSVSLRLSLSLRLALISRHIPSNIECIRIPVPLGNTAEVAQDAVEAEVLKVW